jgi:arylformamidase
MTRPAAGAGAGPRVPLQPAVPLSATFCEREYNARAAVPEHKDFFVRWASRSVMAREKLSHYADLAYGPGDLHTLDFFPCAEPRGLLIFIHGGYWRSLDKSDFSFVAEPFVSRQIAVATINYSLCPAVAIPTIVEECAQAVTWLDKATSRFGLAGKPFVIAGHSAGGHLAAMLHTLDWAKRGIDPGRIKGLAAVSGLFDLEPLLHTTMNEDIRLDAASQRAMSPIHLAPSLGVPLLLFCGALESGEFQRQSHLLHAAWPSHCGEPVTVPGCHHFSIVDHFADFGSTAYRDTLALFA